MGERIRIPKNENIKSKNLFIFCKIRKFIANVIISLLEINIFIGNIMHSLKKASVLGSLKLKPR